MKYEWFIASRYLKSRREQSFISIIGVISVVSVALGIAVVILVISVMNGFEYGLKDKFLANEAHVTVRSAASGFFSDYQETIKQIEAIEGVEAASPVIYTPIAVWLKGEKTINRTIFVKGIDPTEEDRVTHFSEFFDEPIDLKNSPLIESARLQGDETISGGIVLGYYVARHMGVVEGDVLRLVSRMEQSPMNPNAFWAHIRNFVVVGIYESGMYTYDNALGFIHLEAAQKLYQKPDQINMIEVRATGADIAPEVRRRIVSTIRFDGGLRGMPIANTWMESHAPLFDAIKLEKIVTVIIEALIILVAAFNIASTLIMTVMEKTRDIGILRAMGSSKQSIRKVFMVQGSIIGVLGAFFGTILGVSISWLLDLQQVVRPSRWLALIILLPISIQFFLAFRYPLSLNFSLKGLLALLWISTIGLFLYCLAQPIYIDSQVYQLSRLPVRINWFFVGFMNALSFAICWLATVYPAWQASNLNPVEALRYE